MPQMPGEQPVPLTRSLFVWNPILLNLTNSGTERKNIHSCNYSDRVLTVPPSQECVFSFWSLYSPSHIRALSPECARSLWALLYAL